MPKVHTLSLTDHDVHSYVPGTQSKWFTWHLLVQAQQYYTAVLFLLPNDIQHTSKSFRVLYF